MKILITGALGHIGSRFIHGIKPGEFEEVVMIDNLSTQRYASLFNLPKGVKFRFFDEDICTADLDKFFKGIDLVIHFAAIADASMGYDRKDKVEETNFNGTRRVADACVKNNCKLIFPSTTSVYGTLKSMVDENCSPEEIKPQSPYAESKLKAESYLQELGASGGLQFIICRFGTIYGISIGMRFHTAINKFCFQAVMGKPITVWTTALHQKRPYLDLKDAVAALNFIIKKDLFDNRIYNILSVNTDVKNILDIISSYLGAPEVKHVDSQVMNQLSYDVSSARFRERGFEFKGDLKKGIFETIDMLRSANGR